MPAMGECRHQPTREACLTDDRFQCRGKQGGSAEKRGFRLTPCSQGSTRVTVNIYVSLSMALFPEDGLVFQAPFPMSRCRSPDRSERGRP